MRFAGHASTVAVAAGVALGCFRAAPAVAQQEIPAVVPFRPSVATPADLPAPGWPELEVGWNGAKGGDVARRQSVPVLFKLAWSEDWALLLGTDAYDWQRDRDGSVVHSGGDTTVALKYKLPVNDAWTLGGQLTAGLPTARQPIGSGRTSWGVTAIASLDLGQTHVDFNAGATRFGGSDDTQGRWQGAWAVAASYPLPQRFGVTGEISGVAQRGTAAKVQGLAALTYNVSRQVVLDVAVAPGLSRAAPDWQLIAGMTMQLGHWF